MILPIGQMNVPLDTEKEWQNCEHNAYSNGVCITCGEECDHSDIDEGYCLICGEDQTEWLAMAAYDRYKDRD